MAIEINNRTGRCLPLARLLKIAEAAARSLKFKDKEISIAIVGDAAIRRLNADYLGHAYATDVLAFAGEEGAPAEIIIGYSQVERQAGRYNNSPTAELIFVMLHGLLHLAGYTDEDEAKRRKMDITAERLLERIKQKNNETNQTRTPGQKFGLRVQRP